MYIYPAKTCENIIGAGVVIGGDVRLKLGHKLLGCDFASSAASAIYVNQLILVGDLLFSAVGNLAIRNENRSGDVPLVVFILFSYVKDDISALAYPSMPLLPLR